MSAWELPVSLMVDGREYRIRSDFRAVLDILAAFHDPGIEPEWKTMVMIRILYPDWADIPECSLEEAARQAVAFIDAGMSEDGGKKPRLMDWEKDASILIPAVNKVAGEEIRSLQYLHWWTFLGYYMEIGDSTFSQILGIRRKKQKGKKLEKWEEEFYRANRQLIDMKKSGQRPQEEKEELRALFGIRT